MSPVKLVAVVLMAVFGILYVVRRRNRLGKN